VIVPGTIAAIYGSRQVAADWTFIQVISLAIIAAPVSTVVSIALSVLI
jgi:hypothetical protein